MTQNSKHYGKRTCMYDDNPHRRVVCPDWTFTQGFKKRIEDNAKKNEVSKSKYFETVIQNFFILENPNMMITGKHSYNPCEKSTERIRMTLHPEVIKLIKEYSQILNTSSSKYLTNLFLMYETKYGSEIQLKNLIMYIQN